MQCTIYENPYKNYLSYYKKIYNSEQKATPSLPLSGNVR